VHPSTYGTVSHSRPLEVYVQPVAAGNVLPDMPLFLEPDVYVNVPLERAYQSAYDDVLPQDRALLEAIG
jgi:hypothetical protein